MSGWPAPLDIYAAVRPVLQGAASLKEVEALLDRGASPNAWKGPLTPVRCAVQFHHLRLLHLLLLKNADANALDKNGVGPLHMATFDGKGDCVRLLLEANADANLRDKHGQTPLFFSPTRHVCEILVSNKADVNARNCKKQSALHLAAHAGLDDAVAWFAGAADKTTLELPDQNGRTPLHYAKRSRVKSTITALQKKGNVRLKDLRQRRQSNSSLFRDLRCEKSSDIPAFTIPPPSQRSGSQADSPIADDTETAAGEESADVAATNMSLISSAALVDVAYARPQESVPKRNGFDESAGFPADITEQTEEVEETEAVATVLETVPEMEEAPVPPEVTPAHEGQDLELEAVAERKSLRVVQEGGKNVAVDDGAAAKSKEEEVMEDEVKKATKEVVVVDKKNDENTEEEEKAVAARVEEDVRSVGHDVVNEKPYSKELCGSPATVPIVAADAAPSADLLCHVERDTPPESTQEMSAMTIAAPFAAAGASPSTIQAEQETAPESTQEMSAMAIAAPFAAAGASPSTTQAEQETAPESTQEPPAPPPIQDDFRSVGSVACSEGVLSSVSATEPKTGASEVAAAAEAALVTVGTGRGSAAASSSGALGSDAGSSLARPVGNVVAVNVERALEHPQAELAVVGPSASAGIGASETNSFVVADVSRDSPLAGDMPSERAPTLSRSYGACSNSSVDDPEPGSNAANRSPLPTPSPAAASDAAPPVFVSPNSASSSSSVTGATDITKVPGSASASTSLAASAAPTINLVGMGSSSASTAVVVPPLSILPPVETGSSALPSAIPSASSSEPPEPIDKEVVDDCISWTVTLTKQNVEDKYGFVQANAKIEFETRLCLISARTEPQQEDECYLKGPEALIVRKVHEGGLLEQWNKRYPEAEVFPHDRIICVNDERTVDDMQREIRTRRIVFRCVRYPERFKVILRRAEKAMLGFKFERPGHGQFHELRISEVLRHGLLSEHNEKKASAGDYHAVVLPDMRIEGANDVFGDAYRISEELKRSEEVVIHVRRAEGALYSQQQVRARLHVLQALRAANLQKRQGSPQQLMLQQQQQQQLHRMRRQMRQQQQQQQQEIEHVPIAGSASE